MSRRAWITATVAILAGASGAVVLAKRGTATPESSTASSSVSAEPPTTPRSRGKIDWVAASSGATPEFTQVSLEQDIALAASVLTGNGRVLFAAGTGRPVVQVLTEAAEPDPVTGPLRDLFSPRGGRDATYRSPQMPIDAPATSGELWRVLRDALPQKHAPLLLLLGGHGYPGEAPIDNTVGLWASSSVSVGELASLLDEYDRPTRLVVTTCFSGGFADIVFRDGAAESMQAPHPHCGLFSAPWDLEASGCDPDPDRARQEGYALHFFNALVGRDRDGNALPSEDLDLNGDGRVSLLEAHTRVRIASSGPDVPTTTSERWLRHASVGHVDVTKSSGTISMPEEKAVVTALSEQLQLEGRERDAAAQYRALEDEISATQLRLQEAQDAEELAFHQAAADILARWPVLDNPWHPEFDATVRDHRDALRRHFGESESYSAYLAAREEADRLDRKIADTRAKAAPLERLARAVETIELAHGLSKRGGRALERYRELLACERWVPPVEPTLLRSR